MFGKANRASTASRLCRWVVPLPPVAEDEQRGLDGRVSHREPNRQSSYQADDAVLKALGRDRDGLGQREGEMAKRLSRSSLNQSPAVMPPSRPGPKWRRKRCRATPFLSSHHCWCDTFGLHRSSV